MPRPRARPASSLGPIQPRRYGVRVRIRAQLQLLLAPGLHKGGIPSHGGCQGEVLGIAAGPVGRG
eukprot:scaffold610813_cov52-Prasinocladus_malaysianus.AAC.1